MKRNLSLFVALSTTFLSSMAYGAERKNLESDVISLAPQMYTATSTAQDFIAILEEKRTTSIEQIKETNESIKKNLELILGTPEQKIQFLDWCYTRWAPGLLDPKVHGHGQLKEDDALTGHAIFKKLYDLVKNKQDTGNDKVKFPETVSKWGDANRAAKLRVALEELILTPGVDVKIAELVNQAYFLDYANFERELTLPQNPHQDTQYFFLDAKTSDVAQSHPNNVVHILADSGFPGGGVLKGTFLQEEATVTSTPETLLALLAISDFAYPLKPLQAVTVGDAVFVPMVDLRPGRDAPMMTQEYVNTVVSKMDAVVSSAILRFQHKPWGQRTLILGAAGCGAFENSPVFVAKVFEVILSKYHGYFNNVTFAVLNGNKDLAVKDKPESGLKYQPFMDLVETLVKKYSPQEG